MNCKIRIPIKLDNTFMSSIALFMFFCSDFIRLFVNLFFGFLTDNSNVINGIVIIIIYIPILLLIFYYKNNNFIDFVVLLIIVVIIFGLSYFSHPENEYYFTRNIYGVSRVFRPDRALYAYLFVRFNNNSTSFLTVLKYVSLILFFYWMMMLIRSIAVGYWEDYDQNGNLIKMKYNLTFGYNMLLPCFTFIYIAMKSKKNIYYILACISVGAIFIGGSRGPLLCIGIFVLFVVLKKFKDSKHKIFIVFSVVVITSIIFLGYEAIINYLSDMLQYFGINSRSLTRILNGTIFDDNGRNEIWAEAIELIKKRPLLGYGVYGDRPFISEFHFAGYCHNLILELATNFGVIITALIIIIIIYNSIKMIFFCDDDNWSMIFLIFFSVSCQLILSMSYWYVSSFWACIAVVVNYNKTKKRKLGVKIGK